MKNQCISTQQAMNSLSDRTAFPYLQDRFLHVTLPYKARRRCVDLGVIIKDELPNACSLRPPPPFPR